MVLLIFIYINEFIYTEKFLVCDRIPTGPYETKCTNIKFNDNILDALCISNISSNTYSPTQLDLSECVKDNNDCDSININSFGNLICE